jgi:hypothetical protein
MKMLFGIPGILFFLMGTLSGQAVALGSAPPPRESDPQWNVSNLRFYPQEKSRWCWAAVAQSVLSSRLEKVPPQCEIVSRVLGRDCCSRSQSCDQGNWPSNGLKAYGVFASGLRETSEEVLIREIQNGRPVMVGLKMPRGPRHVVLAHGIYFQDNIRYVKIFDPLYGHSRVALDKLSKDYWINSAYLED